MTMPPLPKPTGSQWLEWDDKSSTYEALYTADQMLAYGAACAAAERERCAKVCKTSLAAPQQRKPLTDEFVSKVVRSVQPNLSDTCRAWKYEFAQCKHWLDAAHGIGD